MLDGGAVAGVFGAGEDDAEERYVPGAQGFEREQGVVDGAERGAGDEDGGQREVGDEVDHQRAAAERDEEAAGAFDDEGGAGGGEGEILEADGDAFEGGGGFGGEGGLERVARRVEAGGSGAGEAGDGFGVGRVGGEARLGGLPVIGVPVADEAGRDEGFADIGVGAGDEGAFQGSLGLRNRVMGLGAVGGRGLSNGDSV